MVEFLCRVVEGGSSVLVNGRGKGEEQYCSDMFCGIADFRIYTDRLDLR